MDKINSFDEINSKLGEKNLKWYESYCKSVASLDRMSGQDLNDEAIPSAIVQKFGLTFDISWKVIKDIIVKYFKINNIVSGSPRETLRMAAKVGLIESDI